jgi:opacity protein-like surface antigen
MKGTNMQKAYILAAAMAAMASSAMASSFDGFYVGGQIGHNSSELKITEDITPASYEWDGDGIDYGLHAGYGKTIASNVYIGVEVDGELSSAEIKETFGTTTLTASKEYAYGASFRAGYAFDNVMPYVKVGYKHAEFEGKASGAFVGTESESTGGLSFGGGIEAAVADNIAIRGEVARTNYGKFSDTDGVNTITYKTTETAIKLGASYRF